MTKMMSLAAVALFAVPAAAQTPVDGLGAVGAELSELVEAGSLDRAGEILDGLFSGTAEAAKLKGGAAGPRWVSTTPAYPPLKPDLTPSPLAAPGAPPLQPPPAPAAALLLASNGTTSSLEKIVDKVVEAVTPYVERDQTKESKEKYGGCRVKGTCGK